MSRSLVIAGCVALLSSFFPGCVSHMASCDCEPFTEETGKSLDRLNIVKWVGEPSSYCSLYAVSNNVMAMVNISKSNTSSLPVKVVISSSSVKDDNGAIATIWNVPAMLSLMTLPVVFSDKVVYTIQARTVVRTHEKTVEICNRSWVSLWTPLAMLPVPGWADFRDTDNFPSPAFKLRKYHAKTVAVSTVQLLSEVLNEDWPKYTGDRAQYDMRIALDELLGHALSAEDRLRVAERLSAVKDVGVIEQYEDQLRLHEQQLKEDGLQAGTNELKEALAGLLEKLRLKRKRDMADKLLVRRDWQGLRGLCVNESNKEFVSLYNPKAEKIRVEEVCKEMKDALARSNWQYVLSHSKDESDNTIKELAAKAEQIRLKEVRKDVKTALDKGDWQHALVLSRNESDDTIKMLAVRAKESGIKKKGAEADAMLAKENWSDVLEMCDKLQSEVELTEFVQKYRTKAESLKKSIDDRERASELKRIESRKIQIGRLLKNKEYAAVIAECDKESGANPGARLEDQQIWDSFKSKAIQAKEKVDRDAELRRIAGKLNLIERLFEKKDYDSVIKLCEDEHGTNVGSLPEDMPQWKSYRTKALGLKLLQKANALDKSVLNIKGFALGMSMEEVEILLRYYIPSISFERSDNQIKISNHEMFFCQAENGKVIRINLSKDVLEKIFEYDVQTTREWAIAFAREYSIDLRVNRIRDRKSRGSASVSVNQDCYIFKDRKSGVTLTIFDEQDVTDYNRDPEEIKNEAERQVMQMMFAGIANNDIAYSMGFDAARQASDVEYVRGWIKKTFVNEKGAEECTLRLEFTK